MMNYENEANQEGRLSTLYNVTLPFPFKLHEMLEDVTNMAEGESVVSWLPHGKAFRVHKPREFATDILPRYFKQSKYKSFQRQLHIYGFRRINSKDMVDFGAYYHEKFTRGHKDASLTMTRKTIKGPAAERPDTQRDPDFYSGLEDRNHGETTSTARQEPSMILDTPPSTDSRKPVIDSALFLKDHQDSRECEIRPFPVLSSIESKNAIFSSRRKSRHYYARSVHNIISCSDSTREELPATVPYTPRKQMSLVNFNYIGANEGEGSDDDDAVMFFEGKRFFSLDEKPQPDNDEAFRRFSRI